MLEGMQAERLMCSSLRPPWSRPGFSFASDHATMQLWRALALELSFLFVCLFFGLSFHMFSLMCWSLISSMFRFAGIQSQVPSNIA